jgi:uncharacterized protein YkwD
MREVPASGRGQPAFKQPRGKVIAMPTPAIVRRRRYVRWVMASLGAVLMAAAAGRIYLTITRRPSAEQIAGVSADEARIVQLVNAERVKAGLLPLKLSARLTVAARGHSYDMALRHYFSHHSADGVSPAQRIRGSGIDYTEFGENIYVDDFPDRQRLAERALAGWMRSPGHRKNILAPSFNETGVGMARAADGSTYITQDFIRK